MKSQPQLERARCPHDGYLIGLDGRCWFCGQEPDRKRNEGRPTLALAKPQVELEADMETTVDIDTGEVRRLRWDEAGMGQMMFDMPMPEMPMLEMQRRGTVRTDEAGFNQVHWRLEEGDRLTVTVKDGRWIVKLVKAWAEDGDA